MPEPGAVDRQLGESLVHSRHLTREQLQQGLAALQAGECPSLRDVLLKRGWVSSGDLDATAATITIPASSQTSPTLPAPAATAPTVVLPTGETVGLSPTVVLPAAESALPPEAAEAAKSARSKFGKYILVKQLGAGGMAVVYKAWDTLLHHWVALKFIKTQDFGTADETEVKQQIAGFLAEARLAVKLNHPNIARVYELGQIDDKYYMSQYYIDGPSLHELIHGTQQKSLETLFYGNPRKYIQIMRDISEAMGYAHGLNPPVIHRDLKPSNVMLDSSGRAYVVDFGLAKELRVDQASLSGTVKGTPKYMAPEQAEGRTREMDGRTDIWALGVILYEMLTGRAPFEDENIHRLLSKIVSEEALWPRHIVQSGTVKISASSAGAVSIPRELEIIAMKCIQKDRKHRYATCKDLVEDLDRALKGEAISIPEHSIHLARLARRHLGKFVVAALLLLAVGAGVAWKLLSKPEPALVLPPPSAPDRGKEVPEVRRAFAAATRDAFLRKPSEATLAPLAELLGKIEPVLEPAARQGVGEWFSSQAARAETDLRALRGDGTPGPEWLARGERARALLTELDFLSKVEGHRDLLKLSPTADLGELARQAREVADWKGTFTLVASVHPWASLKLSVGGKPVARDAARQEDVTPLRAENLPVGDLKVEFTRGSATKTLAVPAAQLRHGAVVRVWGTLDTLDHRVE